MVTRIFWLGVLFCGFWLFGGCHDDLLEQEQVDKMDGFVYLSRSGSIISESEEMYIKMYTEECDQGGRIFFFDKGFE